MEHPSVWASLRIRIPEYQSIALAALERIAQRGERSLAACEIIVEIDQKRRNTLPLRRNVFAQSRLIGINEIEMRRELLAGLVMRPMSARSIRPAVQRR